MRLPSPIPSLPTLAAALVLAGCATPTPDAGATLRAAEQAMGGTNLKTLRVVAQGGGGIFGQAWQPGMAWPRLNYSVLTRSYDYENAAMREEFGRSRAEPNGGGAVPLMGGGEQRAVSMLRGDIAWTMAGSNPAWTPVAAPDRIHDLWTSPHGVLKAAMKQPSTVTLRETMDGKRTTTVAFTVPGALGATVTLGAGGLVEQVESTLPHPVMGDTKVVTRYLDYQDYGGVKFPSRIVQSSGGADTLDLRVTEVQPNAPVEITVPDALKSPAERVAVEKVAEGVWFLAGGSHNSVAIEMKDQVIVVEAPLYEGRTAAVLAEAKKLAPGKPVRTVINSHHHFDHAGGLRTAAADGATLVTSAMAKPWFEKTFANPNRIAPDALAKSGRTPQIVGVAGQYAIDDGSRRVEVHEMTGSVHAQGFMMVWLPRERLLIEADAYTPGPPGTPPPPAPNANNVNLVQNIERLKLDVDKILPLHSRVVPMSELLAAVGR